MDYLRNLKNFTAGGLLGPITPFKCTRATYNGMNWCWKWIFTASVTMRETGSPGQGVNAFRRINPGSGFQGDTLHVVA